jgi:uncharacterized protein (DUF2235 family)
MEQKPFYNEGVGTGRLDHLLGGAFGWGISKHVRKVYRFLVKEYEPGDEIFLFGFSRGAYTARSVAGFIRNCGILKPEYRDKVGEAYKLYRRWDEPSKPTGADAVKFREQFSYDQVRITFIGVWETVGALGIPVLIPGLTPLKHFVEFHDLKLSSYVDHAYQALAIDERRRPFAPALWEVQTPPGRQTVEQVWFAGVHRNVGGGYPDTELSDRAFEWMIEKAAACRLAVDKSLIQPPLTQSGPGKLEDSMTLLYQLLIPITRSIGGTPPSGLESYQALHPSAVWRMEHDRTPRYWPSNVVEYLKRLGQTIPTVPPR